MASLMIFHLQHSCVWTPKNSDSQELCLALTNCWAQRENWSCYLHWKGAACKTPRHRHLVPLIHLSLRILKPLIQYCPVSIYILHGIHASSCNKWSNMIGYHQIWSKHTIQVKTKHNDACSRVSTMYSCQFGKFLSPLLTTNLQTQVPSSHSIFIILICARLEASHWSGPQCYRAQVLYPKRVVSTCPSTWTNMGWTHLSMLTDTPQTNIIYMFSMLSVSAYIHCMKIRWHVALGYHIKA